MIGVGAVLAGKYRVLDVLGRGGMGTVFRAENLLTGKHVALKCLHSPLTATREATQRLLREARATSSVSHPNVVDIYDVVHDGDLVCLVMELLQGETLRSYLQRNQQPKISEFIALLLPALGGAAAAHARGVIHRDLKPDNIFLARVPGAPHAVAKLLDFGISKLSAADSGTLTRTGAALGTPLYMSLEQLRGDKNIDARTDVYAIGVILYEAISGCLPQHADTLPELAIKLATTDSRPLKSLRPDIPTSLARLIDWALSRDREQRPSLQTLIEELQVFARDYSFREQLTQADTAVPRLAAVVAPVEASLSIAPRASALDDEPSTLRARELPRSYTRGGRTRWRSFSIAVGLLGALILFGWRLLYQPPSAAMSQPASAAPAALPTRTEPAQRHAAAPPPLPPSAAPALPQPSEVEPVRTATPLLPSAAPALPQSSEVEPVHTATPLPATGPSKRPLTAAKPRVSQRAAAAAPPAPAAPVQKTPVEWVGF